MYKDKDKQKEANRLAAQRKRDKSKGMTQAKSIEGMTRTRTTGCKCAIPGDEDYEGCCEKVDGVWRVSPRRFGIATPLTQLPRIDLEQRIRAYPNDQWVNSPEHTEPMRRLRTLSIEQLENEGYHVPAWKVSA